MKDLEKLSEEEKLRLFDVEELETRLEMAEAGWITINVACPTTNEGCGGDGPLEEPA